MEFNKQNIVQLFMKLRVFILRIEQHTRNYFSARGADIYTRFVRRMFFIFIIACFVAGITIFFVLFIASMAKPLTKVPSVKGLNVVEAALQIQEKGLAAEIDSKFDPDFDKFTVIEQYPRKGATVRLGRTVTLLVSMGRDVYITPSLIGLTRQEAEKKLSQLNINYEITIIQTSDFPVNTIISQDIPPNKQMDRSVKLKLLVNSDVSRGEIKIGDYTRQNVDTIVKTLYLGSIQPVLEKVATKNSDDDGLVLSQSIAAGNVVPKNSEIKLQIGVYGEDDQERDKYNYHIFTYILAPEISLSSSNTVSTDSLQGQDQANVVITCDDEKNEQQEIYNKTVRYGEFIITTFKAYGRAKLNLIINNSFVKEVVYE